MENQSPEIMAPVSNRAMLDAAIHNGAHSIYFGMPHFNARGRSDNLSLIDIQSFIELSHLYGLKVYIAFNVLIFENELRDAIKSFLEVNRFAPDAWIIQDVGLALLLKKIYPEIHLHASTQMTIVNSLDIEFYEDLFKRYTLARELSISEIKTIRDKVQSELEVFIHGSLCIAYSGQCFTSSGFGGRSANRGECAQSCRHDYDLFIDDRQQQTDGHYLVSPGDLIGDNYIHPLTQMGIDALKIEGRLKSPEYVAAAVNLIRNGGGKKFSIPARLTYSRNAGPGWLGGKNHSDLVDDKINTHTGILLGIVHSIVKNTSILVEISEGIEIHKGDGILISNFHHDFGGYVYDVIFKQKRFAEIFLSNDFPLFKIKSSMRVFITSSTAIEHELKKSFTDKQKFKRLPVTAQLNGDIGKKLSLMFRDADGNQVKVESETLLEKAEKQPLNFNLVRDEIESLSGTPFFIGNITMNLPKDTFIPNKMVKVLRQKASEELIHLRINKNVSPADKKVEKNFEALIQNDLKENSETYSRQNPRLHILVRNSFQLEKVLEIKNRNQSVDSIYLDFQFGQDYRESILNIKSKGIKAGLTAARIYKPDEEQQLEKIVDLNPDVILLRNTTSLQYLKNKSLNLVGDFGLNITNHLSAEFFLSKGLSRIGASYDLISDYGKKQEALLLLSFLDSINPNFIEINLSYYLPSFYMEYCLFSKYLSNGKDSSQCGFPCMKHTLALKDRKGEVHPVIADRNCRNEMFHGKQKNLVGYIAAFLEKGVKNFRVEMSPDNKDIANDLEKIKELNNYF